MCGEKKDNRECICQYVGSPPRVRGKVHMARSGLRVGRITPACAGKSRSQSPQNQSQWDHPRVCGEKTAATARSRRCRGSPPRVRGKGDGGEPRRGQIGITPACAGKSPLVHRHGCPAQDHPRVCGEKALCESVVSRCEGSPPRVRGKVAIIASSAVSCGITPACAGKRQKQTDIGVLP